MYDKLVYTYIIITAEQGDLGVSSYGISVTTMEEVFMKVREGADETLRHRYIHILYTCAGCTKKNYSFVPLRPLHNFCVGPSNITLGFKGHMCAERGQPCQDSSSSKN